jgi:hypothetical protein
MFLQMGHEKCGGHDLLCYICNFGYFIKLYGGIFKGCTLLVRGGFVYVGAECIVYITLASSWKQQSLFKASYPAWPCIDRWHVNVG